MLKTSTIKKLNKLKYIPQPKCIYKYIPTNKTRKINTLSASITKLNTIISTKLGVVIDNEDKAA